MKTLLMVGLLCALFEYRCLNLGRTLSATADEPGYLVAAYCDTHANLPDIATGNCRLTSLVMGLGLYGLNVDIPRQIQRSPGLIFVAGSLMTGEMAPEPARIGLQRMRAVVTLLSLLLALTLFFAGRDQWGAWGGIIALSAFTLNPVIIANSSLATTDMITTALFTWWLLGLSHAIKTRKWPWAAVTGIVGGLLLAAKISSIILLPIALTVMACLWMRNRKRPNRDTCLLVLTGLAGTWVAFWGVYDFRFTLGAPLGWEVFNDLFGVGNGAMEALLRCAFTGHWLPEGYLVDLMTVLTGAAHRHMYFLHEYSVAGWYGYFPILWLIKTPVSLAIITLLGTGIVSREILRDRGFSLMHVLMIGVAWYAAIAILSRLNIGIRHLLPIYPALCLFAAAVVGRAGAIRTWTWKIALPGCLAIIGIESLLVPDVVSYTSPLWGGTYAGYREITDSAYDWGGDVPRIQSWLKTTGTQDDVYLDCMGINDTRDAGLKGVTMPLARGRHYGAGIYIVSASRLILGGEKEIWGPWSPSYEQVYQKARKSGNADALAALECTRLLAYLRQQIEVLDPIRLGPRIFVYRLSRQEIQEALVGPLPYGR